MNKPKRSKPLDDCCDLDEQEEEYEDYHAEYENPYDEMDDPYEGEDSDLLNEW